MSVFRDHAACSLLFHSHSQEIAERLTKRNPIIIPPVNMPMSACIFTSLRLSCISAGKG
jgi:hypothetical protein